jgi:AraC-like DNA-binding protein
MALRCTLLPHFHRRRRHARGRPWRVPELQLQTRLSRSPSVRLSVRLTTSLSHCSPSNLRRKIRRHIDSARAYRNEAQVGDAVRESGVPREDIFISPCYAIPWEAYE